MVTNTTGQTTAGLNQPDRLASDEQHRSHTLNLLSHRRCFWPNTFLLAGEQVT